MSGAHTNHSSDYPVENFDAQEVPIYAEPELPEQGYIPLVMEAMDPSQGCTIFSLFHLPLDRVTPGGTFQTNTYSLAGNSSSIVVSDKQVMPAYVPVATPNIVTAADGGSSVSKAQFLILNVDPNNTGRFIVQSNGIYSFPVNHNYIIGFTYYLSDTNAGQVTTTPPATDPQPLFTVLDQKTIIVSIGSA